ncbi:MAG: hypothetical protein VX986_01040 [Pseudomonadota bacterium]|nr:hypothetical protein [Pseudomonadota bacterium]
MLKFEQEKHWVFLYWLVFVGFIFFLFLVALNEGYVQELFAADRSKIVFLIVGLYIFGTVRAGRRAKFIAEEIDHFRFQARKLDRGAMSDSHSESNFLSMLKNSNLFEDQEDYHFLEKENDNTSCLFYLVEKCKGAHDLNWFISESILKLGLLGTIIGFILMLGPVIEITTFDVGSMQQILSKMSAGMGTALYTTLAGILGSTTLSFQNLILDKGADNLINQILFLKPMPLRRN